MSYVVLLFVTFCCSILPALGIIGGKPAGDHPYFVLVVRGQPSDQICGGLLVGKQAVLTSASCLYHHEQQRWSYEEELHVIHGNFSNPNGWGGKAFEVEDYRVYIKYTPPVNKVPVLFDIAMIKLRHTILFNGKGILSTCNKKKFSHGHFIGLGVTHQNPYKYPLQLMEATLWADEECGSYGNWLHINKELQLCYHVPERKYACHGDLGGPLLFNYNQERYCIIGIASYHYEQCGSANYPAVFTNAARLENWIKRQKKYFNS